MFGFGTQLCRGIFSALKVNIIYFDRFIVLFCKCIAKQYTAPTLGGVEFDGSVTFVFSLPILVCIGTLCDLRLVHA